MPSTCARCPRPARSNGLCTAHYQAARRAGELPEPTKRMVVVRYDLRVKPETDKAIKREAKRTGESKYGVACRWLDERAEK